METAGRPLGRDRTAIAASIALHLCAVIALATLPRPSFPVDDPDERLLLVSAIHVEHQAPPPRPALTRRTLVPHTQAAKPAFRPVIHTAVTVEHATRHLVVAVEAPNAYATSAAGAPARPRDVSDNPAPSRPEATGAAAPAVAGSPLPSSAPSTATAAPVAQSEEGIGNFGETYPASIEPGLRSALVAVGSGFVVRVTVDENGYATAVEFMRSPPDATLREELRAKLLAARFIPAACNGLRCAGTVELRT
jgi:hypothetical protein